MGRVRSLASLCVLAALVASLAGCGKKSSGVGVKTINLAPATISLEQGRYVGLTVTDNNGAVVPFGSITWRASDGAAVSIALLSGQPTVCAGGWNSLTAPTVCTPGPAESVQLTAAADGATSSPITIYVHQHIERLEASAVNGPVYCDQAQTMEGLSATSQFAPAGFADYRVVATNNGNDITSTVGPIQWVAQNSGVVGLSGGNGLLFNQIRATARASGQSSFFAVAGNATSTSVNFVTCPVRSITLATSTGENSLRFVHSATAQTITATVVDSAGLTLTNPPITWSSTNPTVATVSATGVISGAQTGGAAVTAACLPPTCNIGFLPSTKGPPVYPSTGISVAVSGTASASTAYVASSGCWDRATGPVLGCLSYMIPIPQSSNKTGAPTFLPHTPTSVLMSASGAQIYVGSCVPTTPPPGQPVCNGIAVVNSSGAVTTNNAVTGDVVGVSVSGGKAVISDTSTTPNQVFLYDQPSNAGTQLLLATTDHARSAAFSPDAFQVYITTYQCTAAPCQPANEVAGPLYVYDAVNGLRRLAAPTGVTDVAFHPSGAFAYMTQASNTVTVLATTSNTIANNPSGAPQVLATPGTPQWIRPVRDWDETAHTTHFVVMNGPNANGLELITATTPALGDPLCTLGASPVFTICNSVGPVIDLGQGPLAATQFLLSTDGSAAYVVPKNFSSVFSYNLVSGQKGGIGLAGAQAATTGGLTSDGAFLYVGSEDGMVHVLNTAFSSDTLQIEPTSSSTNPATNLCSIINGQSCNPDFVVVKP